MTRDELVREMMDVLETYDYNPTPYGVGCELDSWEKKKVRLISLFEGNKDYNGRYQIVFKENLPRQIEKEAVSDFFNDWRCYMGDKVEEFNRVDSCAYEGSYEKNQYLWGMIFEDPEKIKPFKAADWLTCYWNYAREIDANSAEILNGFYPELRVHVGQKATRVIGKLCKATGYDKTPWYNKGYANITDALSPGRFKATIVISINPVDYLTMSFGNTWTTCMTIDKKNKRKYGGDYIYRGLSSGGVGSYLEDGTTFIFYILKGDYNGNTPELEGKIYRNLFHFNGNTLIQGRVYPKSKDGATDLYKEFREIVMEHLFPKETEWEETEIGTLACANVTHTKGCHFTDYTHFEDCNVNRIKGMEHDPVVIGSRHHCPNCGSLTNYEKAIECRSCYENVEDEEEEE